MPTGGDRPTGHLVPTGGSADEYVTRGIEEALMVANTSRAVKPAVQAYIKSEVAPQIKRTYAAVAPLAQQVASRGHEGMRTWEAAEGVKDMIRELPTQIERSLSGEDRRVPPEQSTQRALSHLADLKQKLGQLSWKSPDKLASAVREIDALSALLQWPAIESKVVG